MAAYIGSLNAKLEELASSQSSSTYPSSRQLLIIAGGGLEGDLSHSVIEANGKASKGLCAAGELAGSIHDNNRLGGNSLLGHVVFGRVAGKHAAKAMLDANVNAGCLDQSRP